MMRDIKHGLKSRSRPKAPDGRVVRTGTVGAYLGR
jgi:hypothetical protein